MIGRGKGKPNEARARKGNQHDRAGEKKDLGGVLLMRERVGNGKGRR